MGPFQDGIKWVHKDSRFRAHTKGPWFLFQNMNAHPILVLCKSYDPIVEFEVLVDSLTTMLN